MQEEILRGGLSQQKRRRTSRLSAIKSAASELYLSNVCAWIGGLVIWSNMNYLLVLPNLSPTSLHRQAYFHPLQLLCAWKSMLRSFEASCKISRTSPQATTDYPATLSAYYVAVLQLWRVSLVTNFDNKYLSLYAGFVFSHSVVLLRFWMTGQDGILFSR